MTCRTRPTPIPTALAVPGVKHVIRVTRAVFATRQEGVAVVADSLWAATQWAARCLGLDGEIGTLEKGRQADLVVVDGNPLDDIQVLLDPARIELVVKAGAICADRRSQPRPGPYRSPK